MRITFFLHRRKGKTSPCHTLQRGRNLAAQCEPEFRKNIAPCRPEFRKTVAHREDQRFCSAEQDFILCTFISPEVLSHEVDLRPPPSMHTHNRDIEMSSGQATQIHGKNLSSTSGVPKFVAVQFFEIPASVPSVS